MESGGGVSERSTVEIYRTAGQVGPTVPDSGVHFRSREPGAGGEMEEGWNSRLNASV